MKKVLLFAAVILVAACSKDKINSTVDSHMSIISAYVSEDGATKVAVQDNGTSVSHVWEEDDAISIFDGGTNKQYTLSNGKGKSKGTFTGASLTGVAPFYAIYPYNSGATISGNVIDAEFKSIQTYTAGSYDNGAIVMVASTNDISQPLPFKIANSFIQITLTPATAYTVKTVEITSNGGELIAGTGTVTYDSENPTVEITSGVPTVTVTFGTGLSMTKDQPYTFYVALPAVELASGVSVAVTGSDNKMILKKSSNLKLTRNKVRNMPALTAMPSILNLSLANSAAVGLATTETANCYVVNGTGSYAIPIDRKGNSEEISLTGIDAVSVLWEDPENNSEDIIGTQSLYGKYMVFTTTGNKGNALVAAKKSSVIKWSWHIWCTDYTLGTDDRTFTYSDTDYVLMNKMLGASSTKLSGLLYHYGRKDPFRAMSHTNSTTLTLAESIENPTIFGSCNYKPYTDCCGNEWSASGKTIYDPSPVGYIISAKEAHDAVNGAAKSYDSTNKKLNVVDKNGNVYYLPIHNYFIQSESGRYLSGISFFVSGYISGGVSYRLQSSSSGTSISTLGAGHAGLCICMRDI